MFRKFKRLFIYKIKKKINIDLEKNLEKLSLEDLFIKYGTDKANIWGKDKGHGFTQYYENHLNEKKGIKINILEIGSYSGASAAAFSKYLPLSNIYCLDINISNFIYESKNINVFGLDISKPNEINNFFKKLNISYDNKFFDIIIDDGSHKLSDMLFSFNFFFKNLKSNGYYIIEDYKFPNYFEHLNNLKEIKIDDLLNNLSKKMYFESNLIKKEQQKFLIDNIKKISTYKGNSKESDIAFIKKN
tara:strand:+ start:980 stop:1714 length:735 start_codon:yes stop_codon:yes gene_type:complete